jgi:hypothetical protein
MTDATQVYTGEGIVPVYSEGVLEDAVSLAPSKYYPKGTVLGQVLGNGTAVNERQTVTITGTPTGGSFTITYDGYTTAPIAYNATAAAVQAALAALPPIGAGNVTCAGGPLPGAAVTIDFVGSCAGMDHPLMAVAGTFTGGSSPAIAIAETIKGVPSGSYFDAYDNSATGALAGLATAKCILRYDIRTDAYGRCYLGRQVSGDTNAYKSRTAPAFFAGTFRTADMPSSGAGAIDSAGVTDLGRIISGSVSALTDSKTILRIG